MIFLGANAMLLQITSLREFMVVFSGNELDLGITLSLWLLAVGSGSAAAKNVRDPRALGCAVLLTGLIAQPLLSLIPLLRPLLSLAVGETIPLGMTVIATAALLAPACVLIGMQFPLAVRMLTGNAPRAFFLEANGALLGGVLFTFLIAGNAGAPAVLTAVSIAYILIGAVLLRRKAFVLLTLVPLLVSLLLSQARPSVPDGNMTLESRTGSRYGVVEVFRTRGQANIFAGGRFQYSYPDRQADELRAHLAVTLHPHPLRVLVAGGSPGVALEVLKYPGTAVDYIEIDPALVQVSHSLIAPGERQPAFLTDDARRYIKGLDGPRYDLLILNLPEPATANINRLYTVEFFREARRALNAEGVLTLTLPASFGYVGKRMQAANGSIYASLRAVFRHTALSSEEYGFMAASDSPIETRPGPLQQRLRERRVSLEHFHPAVLDDAFDSMKTGQYRSRLAAVTELNTDARPIAYLYDLLVWADMQKSGMIQHLADHGLALVITVLATLAAAGVFLGTHGRGVTYTVFLAGFSSLSFCLVVLLAYQSAYGYVYERVGLLTAAFMAGSAGGAAIAQKGGRPLSILRACEAAGAALLLLAPLFFRHEALYPVVTSLFGMAGGAAFVAAIRHAGADDAAGKAGRLYALDLAGSFLGALLTALVLVPLFGVRNTLLGMVLLKMMSLTALVFVRHEQT
jgi:spermidine synthase